MNRKEFLQESMHKHRVARRRVNEALRNMPYELEKKSRTAIDPIMSKAILDSIETDKKIEADMKERREAAEKLVKWQEDARDGKIEKSTVLKKMHLQESLFEDADSVDAADKAVIDDELNALVEIVANFDGRFNGVVAKLKDCYDALLNAGLISQERYDNETKYFGEYNDLLKKRQLTTNELVDFQDDLDTEIADLWDTCEEAGVETPAAEFLSNGMSGWTWRLK